MNENINDKVNELRKEFEKIQINETKKSRKRFIFVISIVLVLIIAVFGIVHVSHAISKSNVEIMGVGSTITEITRAFNDNKYVKTVEMDDTFETIDDSFIDCPKLKKVNFSDNLDLIFCSFIRCSSLEEITFPDSLRVIGVYSFNSCSNLKKITINNNIEYIADCTFEDCNNIIYNETSKAYYLGNDENPYLVLVKLKDKNITSFEFETGTKIIKNNAFEGSSIETISIPDSVTYIGSSAFLNCKNLKSVTSMGSVGIICNNAFKGCIQLEDITLSDVLAEIHFSAFEDCRKLKYQEIDNQFYLGSLNNPKLVYMGSSSLESSVTIDNDVRIIGSMVFTSANIRSLVIPKNVIYITGDAFDNSNNITSVTYLGNDAEWNRLMRLATRSLIERITDPTPKCYYLRNN